MILAPVCGHHVSPDPLMWLLAAALATQRIELGTSVLQVPLREPFELAQRLITMNVLTGGPFSLGVGVGSTKADFDAAGVKENCSIRALSGRIVMPAIYTDRSTRLIT